jgi:hypothetical protein
MSTTCAHGVLLACCALCACLFNWARWQGTYEAPSEITSEPEDTPEPPKPDRTKPKDETQTEGSTTPTEKPEPPKPEPPTPTPPTPNPPPPPTIKETSFPDSPPGRVIIDDKVLKKMYDIFTATDAVDVDTHMDADEFAQKVTVEVLREALEPIGGLDISNLLKVGAKPPMKLDANVLFWLLDRDGDGLLTIREFLELCKMRYSDAPTMTILQDMALKKLYDMVSNTVYFHVSPPCVVSVQPECWSNLSRSR